MKLFNWQVVEECNYDDGCPTVWAMKVDDAIYYVELRSDGHYHVNCDGIRFRNHDSFKTLAWAKRVCESYALKMMEEK